MKALLFSNFPPSVFENTLKPKFEQCSVEITRVANIDRSTMIDPGDADVVIAMVELMSTGQRQKVKDLAKKHGKKFIALSRKGADWSREFASAQASIEKKVPSVIEVLEPPPPPKPKAWTPVLIASPSPEPEPAPLTIRSEIDQDEVAEMLSLFEQENEKLEEQLKIVKDRSQEKEYENHGLRATLEKTKNERDQQVSEVRKIKKKLEELTETTVSKDSYNKLAEQYAALTAKKNGEPDVALKRQIAELNARLVVVQREAKEAQANLEKNSTFVASAQHEVLIYKTTNENLQKDLTAAEAVVKKQGEELFRIKQENEQLRKNPALYVDDAEIKKLRAENEALRKKATSKTTEDFLKVREAFAVLWRANAMTDRDVLEKLMNWQPKE